MIGIYKITSPSGKIYIGQSRNIEQRFIGYKQLSQNCSQIKLIRSFKKYGYETHIFEIIELCSFDNLNNRERFWQEHYDVLKNGLNCVLQSTTEKTRIYSEETRKKMSESRKGLKGTMKGKKHTDEAKLKMSIKRKGRILSTEWAAKVRINLDKTRGRKSTPEQIEKRKITLSKNGGYVHSEHTIEKIRLGNLGKIRNYKRVSSTETKLLISKNNAKTKSKITLHLLTGVYFDNAKDAAFCFGLNYYNTKAKLNGAIKNNDTNLIYA